MLRFSKYMFVGALLGITLYKSEAVSWFRIFEMFHFQSFHMYGLILSGVATGIIAVQLMKRFHVKDIQGHEIVINDKNQSVPRYLIGGFIFGLGWALAGICPGPMFILLGSGFSVLIVYLAFAMLGTFAYGLARKHIPH